MRRLISNVLVLVSLGFFTLAAAQLPSAVTADAYLLQVEQALRDGDHTRAWARMQDILRLQMDNDLDLPEFHFWYAKAAESVDMPQQALESIVKYLEAEGREARHYIKALELMNTVQAVARCQGWNTGAYFETATPEQVTACLDSGVDVEARNQSGFTPLQAAAARTEDPAIIEALLEAGANVDARESASGARSRYGLYPAAVDRPGRVEFVNQTGDDSVYRRSDGDRPIVRRGIDTPGVGVQRDRGRHHLPDRSGHENGAGCRQP